MKPAQIKPVSYLENHAAEIVRDVAQSREPLLITEDGEPKVIVQDAQSYDDMQQTLALLKILALGRKEIEAGEVVAAKDVFAELKQMDKDDGVV
ncbi:MULTISPECIES: type II toxin-antitoxin system Phd/YefM family antitoxin [Paraburkholderia]|jgi:prevent-host-death family protein|uniref:type II toxin-antitoxin system Phd/YefM family antitoxin n=2 Tax=Bacteria TaxID=2 RepID=UPI0007EDFECE|nr:MULTISPECIES: type II toxin-antitoxin system Phd/YefM family antitoxin [Paraburkholderia]MBB2977314.1 prevent-host-death family protein [Paraburkholderia tropica]MBN3809818.1 type II toxin-antitoxin system Phd/YefM family antitoxin [Paraburkholderia sp. Ac-20347]OBR54888.1 prevent-host-death protein [Paraburkholderia tropica]